MNGIIFDIQRFSVHDGPGIRTNIFFKGCPLHCEWCCNPESQSVFPQPLYDAEQCIGCGSCAAACPSQAITAAPDYRIDYERCKTCSDHPCVRSCYARALTLAGTLCTADEIVELVKRDMRFYASSGGGITCSGGEATMQIDFLVELLSACKRAGIHTAMETCSACSWESLQRTLPYTDLYLCDVKHVNPQKLRLETGGNAAQILENVRRLADSGAQITARVPVIPEFNSDVEEIRQIGEFLLDAGIPDVNLLTFHRLGVPKYRKIFHPIQPRERQSLTAEEMQARVELLCEMGLRASIG